MKVMDGCVLVSWQVNAVCSHKFKDVSSGLLNTFGCIYLKVGTDVLFKQSVAYPITSFEMAFSTAFEKCDVFLLETILTVGYRCDKEFLSKLRPKAEVCSVDGFTIFHAACSSGNSDLVRALISAQWNPNAITIFGKTPLMFASEHGHSDVVITLLTVGSINVNSYSIDGFTALHFAAENNFSAVVSLLLEFGANPNPWTNNGWTPLLFASNSGHTESALLLLRAKANPNFILPDGTSSVFLACKNSNAVLAYYLLKHGANPESSASGITPLMAACENGNVDIVRMLVDKKINLNLQHNQRTALHISCERGHSEIALTLLKYGANPHLKADNDDSPLTISCEQGLYSIVVYLLENGIKPDDSKRDGWTPLMLASLNGHTKIVEELLKRQANPNACSKEGLTALMIACDSKQKNTAIVNALLRAKTSVNAFTDNFTTALHLAASSGDPAVVSLLLAAGADPNFRNTSGVTPLMFAAKEKHVEVISKLLKADSINLNLSSKDNRTALHFASEAGNPLIVRELLLKGSDPNILDINGCSPLMVACILGHVDVVRELLKQSDIDLGRQNLQGLNAVQLAAVNENDTVLEILKEHSQIRHMHSHRRIQFDGQKEVDGFDYHQIDEQQNILQQALAAAIIMQSLVSITETLEKVPEHYMDNDSLIHSAQPCRYSVSSSIGSCFSELTQFSLVVS